MTDRLKEIEALLGAPEPACAAVLERLTQFEQLVRKWNPTINVVAKSTLSDIWSRHILDSLQVFRFCHDDGVWLDLGSGGGFPGIVVAILAAELKPNLRVRLVESDQRKAVFLKECSRQLGLTAEVIRSRIEALEPQAANIVSARALAPLATLCDFAHRHLAEGGTAVFLKGQQVDAEIAEAGRFWHFELERLQSVTSHDASILAIRGLRHG